MVVGEIDRSTMMTLSISLSVALAGLDRGSNRTALSDEPVDRCRFLDLYSSRW